MRVAVITDNDGNYAENITAAYEGYMNNEFENIKVYADDIDRRRTFEVAMYEDNQADCNALFGSDRRTLTVQEYMLANKAEAAYQLLSQKSDSLVTPQYIRNALEWVNA